MKKRTKKAPVPAVATTPPTTFKDMTPVTVLFYLASGQTITQLMSRTDGQRLANEFAAWRRRTTIMDYHHSIPATNMIGSPYLLGETPDGNPMGSVWGQYPVIAGDGWVIDTRQVVAIICKVNTRP